MKNRRKIEIMDTVDQYYMYADTTKEEAEEPGLMLDFCGMEHCRPLHSYGPKRRTNFVIHIVCEGKGSLSCRDRVWTVGKGQMFMLFPGEEAKYQADRSEPWYYCWVGFHGRKAAEIADRIGFSCDAPVLPVGNFEQAEDTVTKMLQIKDLETGGKLRRNAGLLMLLADLMEKKAEETGRPSEASALSYADYAIQYINNHFMEKIRVLDLADRIGISRSYLVKMMRRETGKSPQKYLIEVRMRRACEFLLRTEDPIREIAAECGYEDPLSFSKFFKGRYGVSPSEYRKIHNKSTSVRV